MRTLKVVVFGKGEAGKSTLINQLIPDAMNIEHEGRTVAMDYGQVSFQDWKFHFWGTPGQIRFGPVREVLAIGVGVVVFVNDSSRFFDEEDRALMKEVSEAGVPYVLFVNQKPEGRKERRSLERLIEGFPMPARIIEGSAKSDASVRKLLAALKEVAEAACAPS